jgi:hypothetical protein
MPLKRERAFIYISRAHLQYRHYSYILCPNINLFFFFKILEIPPPQLKLLCTFWNGAANEELFGFGKIQQPCYHHPASYATLLHDPLTTTRMTGPLPGRNKEEKSRKGWTTNLTLATILACLRPPAHKNHAGKFPAFNCVYKACSGE